MRTARLSILWMLAVPGLTLGTEPTAPDQFGPNTAVSIFGMPDFGPVTSAVTFGIISDYKYSTGFPLVAPLRGIPEGALITEINFHFYDVEASDAFEGSLCRYYSPVAGGNTNLECPVSAAYANGNAPGNAVLTIHPALTFRSSEDVGEDGSPDISAWELRASSGSNQVGIKMVRVVWQRQVSPAPGVATFNDVPISDPAFQFVEALAESGITAGCGSGNYCPNAPLTRRQMAVFLAKALGLHWPPAL